MSQTLNITLSDKTQVLLKKQADKQHVSVQKYVSDAMNMIMDRDGNKNIETVSMAEFRSCASQLTQRHSGLIKNLASR